MPEPRGRRWLARGRPYVGEQEPWLAAGDPVYHVTRPGARSPAVGDPAEASLVASAAEGDVSAFERLVELHWPRVYGALARVLGDPAEAVQAAGETFVRARTALPGFRPDERFRVWLYRIAMDEASRRPARPPRDPSLRVPPDEDLRDHLERFLAELPAAERAAVVLRDVEGLTSSEAAEMLALEVSSFRATLHRGRMAIRRRLEDCSLLDPGSETQPRPLG